MPHPSARPAPVATPILALLVGLGLFSAPPTPAIAARGADGRGPTQIGAIGMRESQAGSVLVDHFEAYLRDRDLDAFRRNVAARYTEGTLVRLLGAPDVPGRRAAALALGLLGGYGCNAALAKSLRDPDPTVRHLADNALWAVWFRADTPENNEALETIRDLIGGRKLAEAAKLADALIDRAPSFAEAHNQRAIARFLQGRLEESVADCRAALKLNPFHTGALSGMGQCLLRLDRPAEAIRAFRRALEIQPYNDGLREVIADLEADDQKR